MPTSLDAFSEPGSRTKSSLDAFAPPPAGKPSMFEVPLVTDIRAAPSSITPPVVPELPIEPEAQFSPLEQSPEFQRAVERETLEEPLLLDPSLFITGAGVGTRMALKAGTKGVGAVSKQAFKSGVAFQTLGLPQVTKQLIKAGVGGTRYLGRVLRNPKAFVQETKKVAKGVASGFSKETAASGGAVGASLEGIRQFREEEFDSDRLIVTTLLASTAFPLAKGGLNSALKAFDAAKNKGSVPNYLRPFLKGRGTPEAFQEAKIRMHGDIIAGTEQALEVGGKVTEKLSPGERMRLGQILSPAGKGGRATKNLLPEQRTGITAPEKRAPLPDAKIQPGFKAPRAALRTQQLKRVRELAEPAREALIQIQRELVDVGSLTPERIQAFERQFQAYFPRVMQSKLLTQPTQGLALSGTAAGKSPFLKQRGERVVFEIPQKQKVVGLEEPRVRGAVRKGVAEGLGAPRRKVSTKETVLPAEEVPVGGGISEEALSGPIKKLRTVISTSLESRGMSKPEAQNVLSRLEDAIAKAAREGSTAEDTAQAAQKILRETIKEVPDRNAIVLATTKQVRKIINESRIFPRTRGVQVRTKTGTVTVPAVKDVEQGTERIQALRPLLEKGFVVTDRQGRKITMFKDTPEILRLTPAEKGGLGQMREPGIPLARSIAANRREIAVRRLFKETAANRNWVLPQNFEGQANGFSLFPNDTRKWGALAGRWVRNDIAAEIQDVRHIQNTASQVATRLVRMWKFGKVPLNPSAVARNEMSNKILADLGGLSPFRPSGWKSYAMAAQEMAGTRELPKGFAFGMKKATDLAKNLSKRDNIGQYLQEAKSHEAGNLVSNTLVVQELRTFANGFLNSQSDNVIIRTLDGITKLSQKFGSKVGISPGGIYQAQEAFNKLALFIHARTNMGLSVTDSARFARKYGIDYSNVAPVVEKLRRGVGGMFGAPFITFSSKAIPLYLETMVKHPFRAAKWPIAALGLDEVSRRAWNKTPEQADSERKLGQLNPVRWIRLPFRDEAGRSVFLDMGYIFPFGDLIEMIDFVRGGEGSGGFVGFLPLVNSPAFMIPEAMLNVSNFRRAQIDPLEAIGTPTSGRGVGRRVQFMAQELLPALTPQIPGVFPGGFSAQRVEKAVRGKVDFAGRPIGIVPSVLSSFFGLRTKAVDPGDERGFRIRELKKQINRLQGAIIKIQMDTNLSDPEKREKRRPLENELVELFQRVREVNKVFQETR